ncbi:hypothetical protein KDA_33370 [Dictyobacter alpinus]|uniref:Response regulatory domain-containing protein n=1 Tax=Dictyobacter alpinus TaxID=2014873 RepID=A0A402B8X3_9CHLR|nr:response regulator [Dictyobacter alpinus]GCE27853.1 hypothetical protein KDA_33370 [Dictyobacter alpinus]
MLQPEFPDQNRLPVVLVVDDNPAIRDMVSWALELDGYEPVVAAEGQEALDWVKNAAREGRYPSVILLDLSMPGMDGSTFLARLQEYWHSTSHAFPLPAVVVITARSGNIELNDSSVERIIVKPFHVRDLLDAVRVLIN